jgi:hypothetical protein
MMAKERKHGGTGAVWDHIQQLVGSMYLWSVIRGLRRAVGLLENSSRKKSKI